VSIASVTSMPSNHNCGLKKNGCCSCSHAGIVNVVKDALTKFSRPIYMVRSFFFELEAVLPKCYLHEQIIGGLHLAGQELSYRIPPTVNFLSSQLSPSLTYILPMHCSGFNSKVALQEAFGEGCVPAGVGLKVQINGD